jgi:hypothetical protein
VHAHDRRIAIRLALLLAAALAILHRGHFMSTDELGVFFQAQSLAREGTLAVPARVHLSFPGRDGRSYSQYVVGQSLLAAPFHSLGALVAGGLGASAKRTLAGPIGAQSWQGEPAVGTAAFSVLFYPPVVAGALAALFFLFERQLGACRRSALLASLALAFCTHAALQSTLFLQHGTEALLTLGAFFFWHRYRSSGAPRDVLLGAACAAAILNVRAAGALNGVALGGYLLFAIAERARGEGDRAKLGRTLANAALPVALSAALYVAVNWLKWGTLLESPQLEERSTLGGDPRAALAGFLFSPGMSVFLYTPLLTLSAWALPAFWRRHSAEAVAVAALFATTLALYASYALWTGLFSCPGPRYLFSATVLALLPLGPWLDGARGLFARASFAALAGCGAIVQALSIGVSWSRLIAAEGWYTWQPAFGFVFDWHAAPLPAAARRAFDPVYWDLWLPRTALGWPGQPGKPLLAIAVLALWTVAVALLALRLRRALAEAEATTVA